MEAVAKVDPTFAITTIVNDAGEVVDLFCGDWVTSHRAACDAYASGHTIKIPEKRDIVVASCSGFPHDINMIQAHKTLDAAARACNDRGTIVLFAECSNGIGRDDFLNWFAAADSREIAANLCKKYQVNGQTAWNLLRIAERFDIRIFTRLETSQVEKMRLTKVNDANALPNVDDGQKDGYILASGAKFAILE
jgi:nickel-dependent lactate racemase